MDSSFRLSIKCFDSFRKKGAKITPSGFKSIILPVSTLKLAESDWSKVNGLTSIPYWLISPTLRLIPMTGLFQYPSSERGFGRSVANKADFFEARVLARKFGLKWSSRIIPSIRFFVSSATSPRL